MYFITPDVKSVRGLESILERFYMKEKEKCHESNSTSCQVRWWYNTCIGNEMNDNGNAELSCPFFRKKVHVQCQNGSWNLTESEFFYKCRGNDFLFLSSFENHMDRITLPFLICLFLTSVFKISVYNEIGRDFNWRLIIWVFNAITIRCFMQLLMVVFNSDYLISNYCISIAILYVAMNFFGTTCFITLHMYVYIIMFHFEIQLRVIKSAMIRVTIMTPCIATIACMVIDLHGQDRYNFFNCETDLYNSRIFIAYFVLHFFAMIVIIGFRIFIEFGIRKILKEGSPKGTFRMEYDIVGERKEIPKREIIRVRYILNCILSIVIVRFVFYIGLFIQVQYIDNHTNYKFFVYNISISNIIDAFFPVIVVWMNNGLRTRMSFLEEWYNEIKEEKNTGKNEEDFKKALKKTDDENEKR